MLKVGYHCSHEQFKPSELLTFAQRAEQAGFTAALSSDHFHPWTTRQGQSGFAWSWLGAAMQATSLSYGIVNAPGQRYHPAIIAQAAATLAEMFPERFWISVGSGQALNELITGDGWPMKAERNARLKECVDIMRALWAGETVTHKGLVTVEEAKLYSRPKVNPLIFGAAITPQTAQWIGGWADGLITVSQPKAQLQKVVDAFRRGGGEGKPMHLKIQISYARTQQEAKQLAYEQWRSNVLPNTVLTEIRNPEQFDALGDQVNPAVVEEMINISADIQQHIAWLEEYRSLGFEQLLIHNVNREQELFIDTFGEKVIPQIQG
ncbi:TIGR03885 family FMN-dependent LLM class oxidoreductase [Siphonobacter sp.]|uniref:TIGR03885 family FMN-dependent LLM class oxidoreductase n=1 Tax=Siphonobacter sp. TaxID=1869184 RepID=UPI003B3AAD88